MDSNQGSIQSTEADKKRLIIVSAPIDVTDEALEYALNAPYEDGYYFDSFIEAQSGLRELRALYRLRVRDPRETLEAATFVRENPGLTPPQIIAGLAAKGITRGTEWVRKQRLLAM